jgi:tyrosine-protein kinase Etk/Wzc
MFLPVAPKKPVNYLIGFGIGFGLPLLLITIKNILNSKIEDPKFLANKSNIPFLGVIGRSKLGNVKVVIDSPKSGITESFRSLRSDMSYLAPKEGNLTILFTSSVSGEGKTFCSINMASVYALADKKVILIGLDLRKPKIAEDFGLTNDIGISSILSSSLNWRDTIKDSGYPNFDIILSGPIPPNPAELLLQDKFALMLNEIKQEYDIIILDCPPVGLVSETKDLFRFSDVNIYIFRHNYSERDNYKILENLKQKGDISKVYTMLNDFAVDNKYGYGYGYGYGKDYGYYEDEQKIKKKKSTSKS